MSTRPSPTETGACKVLGHQEGHPGSMWTTEWLVPTGQKVL